MSDPDPRLPGKCLSFLQADADADRRRDNPKRAVDEPVSSAGVFSFRTYDRRALRPAIGTGGEGTKSGVLVAFDILMEPKFSSSAEAAALP